ncbi:MAG: DNA repair protein RecO [Bacilli bacterium]|jgi:DNA repair protein RecO (recombination protein O)|nr:DNA repair protein RecO [Bacilli bacterium]
MIKKVTGIIINDRDYSESSKIIYVLTKEYGLISMIAKGVKRLKSKLRGGTIPLTYGYFHIYYKEDKLSTLIEVDIIDNFRMIKKDLNKLSYASYLCELSGQVIKQATEKDYEKIYNLLIAALFKINEGFKEEVITNILELKMLSYLGVEPKLDACIKCGNVNSIVTVDADKGGFLCLKCRTNEYIVKEETIKTLRMYVYLDINKITKLAINPEVSREIDRFINNYYERYTGLYLNSKQFLSKIKQ